MDAKQNAELEVAVTRYRDHGRAVIAGDLTKSPYHSGILGQVDYAPLAADERTLAQAYLAYIAVPTEKASTFESQRNAIMGVLSPATSEKPSE